MANTLSDALLLLTRKAEDEVVKNPEYGMRATMTNAWGYCLVWNGKRTAGALTIRRHVIRLTLDDEQVFDLDMSLGDLIELLYDQVFIGAAIAVIFQFTMPRAEASAILNELSYCMWLLSEAHMKASVQPDEPMQMFTIEYSDGHIIPSWGFPSTIQKHASKLLKHYNAYCNKIETVKAVTVKP